MKDKWNKCGYLRYVIDAIGLTVVYRIYMYYVWEASYLAAIEAKILPQFAMRILSLKLNPNWAEIVANSCMSVLPCVFVNFLNVIFFLFSLCSPLPARVRRATQGTDSLQSWKHSHSALFSDRESAGRVSMRLVSSDDNEDAVGTMKKEGASWLLLVSLENDRSFEA